MREGATSVSRATRPRSDRPARAGAAAAGRTMVRSPAAPIPFWWYSGSGRTLELGRSGRPLLMLRPAAAQPRGHRQTGGIERSSSSRLRRLLADVADFFLVESGSRRRWRRASSAGCCSLSLGTARPSPNSRGLAFQGQYRRSARAIQLRNECAIDLTCHGPMNVRRGRRPRLFQVRVIHEAFCRIDEML